MSDILRRDGGTTAAEAMLMLNPANQPIVNVKSLGARGDGVTDDSAIINAAIASLPSGKSHGGVVYFPPGQYICSSTVTMQNRVGVTLEGAGGLEAFDMRGSGGSGGAATQIVYTGSTRAVDMRGGFGCFLKNLQVLSSAEAMTGNLVDMEGAVLSGMTDVACTTGGVAPIGKPVGLYLGGKTDCCTFIRCKFNACNFGVVGRIESEANAESAAHTFIGCTFVSNQNKHVLNAGKGWFFYGCTAEQLRNNKGEEKATNAVGFYSQQGTLQTENLNLINCWIGDGEVKNGTQIDFQGTGLNIIGCELAVGTKGVVLEAGAKNVTITGNRIERLTTALEIGAGCQRVIYQNNSANEITGTEVVNPTNATGAIIQTGAGEAFKEVTELAGETSGELKAKVNEIVKILKSTGLAK